MFNCSTFKTMGKKHKKKVLSKQERISLKKEQAAKSAAFNETLRQGTIKLNTKHLIEYVAGITNKGEQRSVANSSHIECYDHDVYWRLFHHFNSHELNASKGRRQAYVDLLIHVDGQHCRKLLSEPQYLDGLFNMALHHTEMLRPVDTWQRKSHNADRQFNDLLKHCFAQYAVPQFLANHWLTDWGRSDMHYWYIQLGRGCSVRKLAGMPVQLTKKMGHYMLQAPPNCLPAQAIRWGQVMGMGGCKKLAKAITNTRLGSYITLPDKFWVTVLQFFINQELEDHNQVGPLIDFIAHCRDTQTNFSLKGRSLKAMHRQMELWHRELATLTNIKGITSWRPSGIWSYYETLEVNDPAQGPVKARYYVTELLSAMALIDEGKTMRHCVASYAQACSKGGSTIFSY